MGKQNKQRRAKRRKQRDQQHRARPAPSSARAVASPQTAPPRREPSPPTTEALLDAALWTVGGDAAAHDRLLELLGERDDAQALADRCLAEAVAGCWGRGWSPADLVHVVARIGTATSARLAVEAVRADTGRRLRRAQALDRRWLEEVEALAMPARGAAPDLATRVSLLGLLRRLPGQPTAVPPPGSAADPAARHGLDQRILERVRALLAKAESTEFDEEAEALTAKAQQLIARHVIDEALLQRPEDVGAPALRRVHLDDPYLDAKAVLLQEVAAANGCRGVFAPDLGWVTLVGYDSALDAVELLHASLLAQATAAMARHGSRRDAAGRSRTRSFRRSFLLGFAGRIGERLQAASAGQGNAEERRRALPVLAGREERVAETLAAAFPGIVDKAFGVGHAGGYSAGRVAAELASLDASSAQLPTHEEA
jgi:hypothetical protein